MVLFFSSACFTNNNSCSFSSERIKHNLLVSHQLVIVWELVEKYRGAIFEVMCFPLPVNLLYYLLWMEPFR